MLRSLYHFFQSAHADVKPGYDSAHSYAIHITASQFLDKPRDASSNVARSCDYEFAAERCISETVQAIIIVIIACVILLNGVLSNDLVTHNSGFKVTVVFKSECLITVHAYCTSNLQLIYSCVMPLIRGPSKTAESLV